MAINLTTNIISWWKLDEVSGTIVNDSEGNHNGTTVANISAITSEDSPNGRIRSFDINDISGRSISMGDHADFSFGDGATDSPFSVSAWVKIGSFNNGTILSKTDASSSKEYVLQKHGGEIFSTFYDESSGGIADVFATIFGILGDSEWGNIVFTYDGTGGSSAVDGMRMYLNGSELTTIKQNDASYVSMENTSSSFIIGDRDTTTDPFDGIIADVMLFDKSLTDGEVKYLYNDGFGVEDFKITDLISSPTITFPNGGESFTEGDIEITWKEPGDLLSTELTWYEIFITDDFNKTKKPELIQIATIPSGNKSYTYKIQKNLRGNKSRIGVRSVNHRGLRSNMSFSADSFTIINEFLPSPSLMSPIKGDTYFSYIPFTFDHNAVLGRSSQRSFYQVYYKSDILKIDWELLHSNIMVGSDPVNIDVSSFSSSSDYIFKIEMVDGDNVSAPLFIDAVSINSDNLFIIDTTAPKGVIKIVNNKEYVKDTGLIIQLSASDEHSGVKNVQIQQTDVLTQSTNDLLESPFLPVAPLSTWDIVPEDGLNEIVDGVKLIQARFADYGGNVLEESKQKIFRTYDDLNNRKISSFLYGKVGDESNLYYVFEKDSTIGASSELYKDLTLVSTLSGDSTALEIYKGVLYIAVKDSGNKGILQRLTTTVDTVADNDSQFLDASKTIVNSLYSADSIINAMEVFDSTLFMGLDNGEILSFKGSTISSENNDNLNNKSIRNMVAYGGILYVFFHNTTEILLMSKDSSGDYVFNTINTESQ